MIPLMKKGLAVRSGLAHVSASLLLWTLVAGVAGHAQSGRRVPKPSSPPPQTETPPADSPEPSDQGKAGKGKLPVIVVPDIGDLDGTHHFERRVVNGCVERLGEAAVIEAIKGPEMNRKEAQDRAKESKDAHVVWLDLKVDSMNRGRGVALNPDDLVVEYILFAPDTGKVKSQGRVYLRNMARAGNVGIGLPTPTGGYAVDYLSHRAGREAADRVMGAIGVTPPLIKHAS